jgi:hypothetical protein
MDSYPSSFIDESIEAIFDKPPALEKLPTCPDGFVWRGQVFKVTRLLLERQDFTRRGKMARNMAPEHAAAASRRGSWGVGRFHYRVEVEGGRVFDLYYDRAPGDADDRKGRWILKGERTSE